MVRLFLAAAVISLSLASSASASPAGPTFVIRQLVADYAKWRPVYDAHQPTREGAGLTNCRVKPSVYNPNDILVVCDMADLAKAKAFTASKNLADAMASAGVVGKPSFFFLAPPR